MAESAPAEPEGTIIETLQSLVVAFVLAMTFRGFVTEGFVIPTGSMAPTLMGQHFLWRSEQTGYRFPLDIKGAGGKRSYQIRDPMLGSHYWIARPTTAQLPRVRMGDRILVIKCLYPFRKPDRFDVVVFKNPTDPDGEAENYIKRLVGLPDESIWLLDGDVFVVPAPAADALDRYAIQRKPEHVQRAVWQVVHHSDYVPVRPQRLEDETGRRYTPGWSGGGWEAADRAYRTETAAPTTLVFDTEAHPINDRTTYNMLTGARPIYFVSDVRVTAGLVAEAAGLETTLELESRGRIFRFTIAGDEATLGLWSPGGRAAPLQSVTYEIEPLEPGEVCNVEFWHVDQAMHLFVNGERAGDPLLYDWKPTERVRHSYQMDILDWQRRIRGLQPTEPSLRWHFSGAPVTLHRVGVYRDLYYRPDTLDVNQQKNRPRLSGQAFGTSPLRPAVLGPDQFFMLGDNSPASSDSRLWGSPHPLVAHQIDESPFVVNRKLLLGKAWVVYFPAPYPVNEGGRGLIPDFGRLRFIR